MLDVSAALKNPGSEFGFERELTLEPCEMWGYTLTFENAALSGRYFSADEVVSLRGLLTVTVNALCARCLAPVKRELTVPVDARFSRASDGEDSGTEVYPLVGHEIDLDEPAFEGLMLGLPMRFLCSEGCKGLCPVCGKNRNQGLCTCPEGVVKPNPFSALNSIFPTNKHEEV